MPGIQNVDQSVEALVTNLHELYMRSRHIEESTGVYDKVDLAVSNHDPSLYHDPALFVRRM